MRFMPTRVVRVTSAEDLESALRSADQVIVEGDDQLLSYAVNKAANDDNGFRVDIQNADLSLELERSSKRPRVSKSAQSWKKRAGVTVAVAVFLSAASLLVFMPGPFREPSSSPVTSSSPQLPPPISARPPSDSPPYPPGLQPLAPDSVGSQLQVSASQALEAMKLMQYFAWPFVAIVAIIALFFIARQAIAGGQNVEIQWKVTEKVSDRVVITKVRSRKAQAAGAATSP